MDMQLQGKRAFVSGSTQGIGYAIARGLLAEGATVVINGRNGDRLRDAERALSMEIPGASVTGLVADLGHRAQVDELLDSVEPIDILVNTSVRSNSKPLQISMMTTGTASSTSTS